MVMELTQPSSGSEQAFIPIFASTSVPKLVLFVTVMEERMEERS
jgi:hypothetical protein